MRLPALLAVMLLSAGCSQQSQTKSPEAKAAPEYFKVDPSTAASLRGTVRFAGKVPAAQRISMDAEAACQALHKSPVPDRKVLIDKAGGLANVFVYVKSGLEGRNFAPTQEAVVLDQRGCQFVPRVIAIRSGQTLRVRNSDPVSHNIHPMPRNNRDWNQHQAPQAPDLQRRFARPEVMIPVKCNVHSWMRSYIGVLHHPFFAVTDPGGGFAIEGLPPGEYTIGAWHEVFGEISQPITLTSKESGAAKFVFRQPRPN